MQPCKTGDQPYSDPSPNGECSLLYMMKKIEAEQPLLGKYHCAAWLQFVWCAFSRFNTPQSCLVKSNPVKLETSCTVILPPMASAL